MRVGKGKIGEREAETYEFAREKFSFFSVGYNPFL